MKEMVIGVGQCGRRCVWELFYTLYYGMDTSVNQLTLRLMASRVFTGFSAIDTVSFTNDPRIERFWKITRRGKSIVLDEKGTGGIWVNGRSIAEEKQGVFLKELEKNILESRIIHFVHGPGGTGAGATPVLSRAARMHVRDVLGAREAANRLYMATMTLASERSVFFAANTAAAIVEYLSDRGIDALVVMDNARQKQLGEAFEKSRMFREGGVGLGLYPRLGTWAVNKLFALHTIWTTMMSPVLVGPGRVLDLSKEREASELKTLLAGRGEAYGLAVPFYFEISREWLKHFTLEFLVLYGILKGMAAEIDYRRGFRGLLVEIGIPVSLRHTLRYDEESLEEFLSNAFMGSRGIDVATITYSSRRPVIIVSGYTTGPYIPRLARYRAILEEVVENPDKAEPGLPLEDIEVVLREYERALPVIMGE